MNFQTLLRLDARQLIRERLAVAVLVVGTLCAAAAVLAGAAIAIPPFAALASVLLWPLCGLAAAVLAFRRITP